MILTFDPSGLKSGYECVEFLKQKGITISQKLGARLIALNSRRIQISPAVLEDTHPGSKLESLFLSHRLTDEDLLNNPSKIKELASEFGEEDSLRCIVEDNILKIVSTYELESIESERPELPVLAQTPSELLSMTSISPRSILSDRRFLEEITLNFLDSEDPRIVIESLKKLTRIVLLSSRDPSNLFRAAFAKDNPIVWAACASIIKEMINPDIGLHLENFLKEEDSEKRKSAFRIVLNDAAAQPDSFLGESVLQIIIKSLQKKGSFPLFAENQASLLKLVKRYPAHIEEFIKNIFFRYYEHSPEELCLLRDFLHTVAHGYKGLTDILICELKKNNPGQYKIILAWILSPLPLSGNEEESIIHILKNLLKENIKDPNLLLIMKTTLLRLAPRSLIQLSTRDFYACIDREIRLFVVELWEQYFSTSKSGATESEEFLRIILTELNGIDLAMQKSILRLKTLQNPIVLEKLRNKVFNISSLIEAAAFTFVSYQNIEETTYLFKILQELIPDSPKLCFELLEKKYYLEEEFEDYIPFLAQLIAISQIHSRKDREFLERVINFLNILSREKKTHAYIAIEGLGVIYSRISLKKNKITLFVKRIIRNSHAPFEVQIRTLSILFLSQNLTPQASTMIEDFFIDKLRTKSMRSPDLSFLLEQINFILNSGKTFSKTDEIVNIFGKEIAFKLTQPTITEMMRSEASLLGPSKFMAQYETNPWKWEDVTEALFILLKMFMDSNSSSERKHRILHIISYLVHHWSLSSGRKDESSRFFLSDIVLFRILRNITGSVDEEHASMISRIMNSVLSLVGKGRESLVMNEDLQHFLTNSCALLKDEIQYKDMDFPIDSQRETVKHLIRASQNGSTSAQRLLLESLEGDWLRKDNRLLITSFFQG